ncbi:MULTISPECIES: periplasmic nitrate reductase, NapE protein [Halomonas]|uniref:Periplasmic nitrate reductase protein NapE n=1 Tax=Halomonas chromatireducens TaxID=507626 RepID=A0A125R082_9GAMM|nr:MULTISPECIES: periplasmic nitrate reductase, NapE protein [Halomonas]AMD01414.1 Periplasmic nitrate reductase protein NapE [Halomonas chromatireducens]MBZ0332250.1 periplasmic nitrate reductase, NapE protein [Halomonas sp. ANAO-440]
MEDPDTLAPEERKKKELKLFLFIAILLFPILAIALVGSFGFSVWIYQTFTGPPGPPG